MSVTAFCQRARVPASSFYYWQRKLRRQRGATALPREGGRPGFAEVRILPEGSATCGAFMDAGGESSEIELRLPGQRRIVVRRGFDRRTLLDLVSTLEGGA
jgi:hypothetical protein